MLGLVHKIVKVDVSFIAAVFKLVNSLVESVFFYIIAESWQKKYNDFVIEFVGRLWFRQAQPPLIFNLSFKKEARYGKTYI